MHSLKDVAGVLGSDALPGIVFLVLSVAALCVWEVEHLTDGQTIGGRHHRLIPRLIPRLIGLTGLVLGAASFVLMAARFIWVA
jgi:hypothetical protein